MEWIDPNDSVSRSTWNLVNHPSFARQDPGDSLARFATIGGNAQVAVKLRRPSGHVVRSHRAMCSATMIVGRFGVPVGTVGIIEASATVKPSIP